MEFIVFCFWYSDKNTQQVHLVDLNNFITEHYFVLPLITEKLLEWEAYV